jgi:hypothetical protein
MGNNAWVICDNIWKWEVKGEFLKKLMVNGNFLLMYL